MKQFLAAIAACCSVLFASAQYGANGKVVEKETGRPLEGVTLTLKPATGLVIQTTSDKNGTFQFSGLKQQGTYQLTTGFVGMQTKSIELVVNGATTQATIELERQPYYLEPLEIRSIRASDRAPFTKSNITKAEIEKINLGQDLPMLLNQTPSVVVNSDAGNGIGYTGFRIRGSDATRVNVTLNGIPYNDAESQGSFFVNLPDLTSSVSSIQLQRGVGTSSNGAGAFGGTLNISTNEFNETPYAELNNSVGSFNSWKHTVKAGSGLLNDHFTVDARLSKVSSDGFVDRAASDLRSFYFSTAYINKSSSLRFNMISGKEKTYQAWNGVTDAMLNTNRTFNSAGTDKPGEPYDNETDNYQQDNYQLLFNHQFNDQLSFNTALFLTKGKGYYEQYKAGAKFSSYGLPDAVFGNTTVKTTDLVRQLWLDNDFYGQVASIRYKTAKSEFNLGGGWNTYEGNHFGEVIWAQTSIPKDYRWYDLDAKKTDQNIYAKWQYNFSNRWQAFTDVQYRHVKYAMNGFRNNPTFRVDRSFDFINPKAGISYTFGGLQAYFSYALGNKEPNRDDYEAGVTEQPKHETLHDFELGVEKKLAKASWGATAYYMNYRNQLILTGRINDVGAYTRQNVPNSYRLGLELQGAATFNKWISVNGNVTLSRNKISNATEFIDDYDNGSQKAVVHNNADIAFSPSIVAAAALNIMPVKNLTITLPAKYVGRQYLDNTSDKSRSLDEYYVQDLRVLYTLRNKLTKVISVIAQVNNLFNKQYESNGYTFSYITGGALTTENYYFPMAGTNVMVGLNIKL